MPEGMETREGERTGETIRDPRTFYLLSVVYGTYKGNESNREDGETRETIGTDGDRLGYFRITVLPYYYITDFLPRPILYPIRWGDYQRERGTDRERRRGETVPRWRIE